MLERIKSWFGLAERQTVERPETAEIGVSGTPIFGGFLQDAGEYNPNLAGLSAFRTYEQMRRSDAQVAATLLAIKLPIRSAQWTVTAPQDATPIEQEAADFIREELLEHADFDAALENALLMLDFGVAAHEDVYRLDGNRVRIEKLAPRLPHTFNRFLTEPGTDRLAAIEQQGYRGENYLTVAVPVAKLALFTFQQEGANYAGRSLLRAMYQHWYIKNNLYKIDAIAQERNGMGIPVIRMGPQAKTEDRKAAIAWLEQLSVHEKAAILLPPEWEFDLKGVSGETRDAKDSIAHHNVMISMAGLSTFLQLGQTETGSRAVGGTLSDFFYLSEQALAARIARVFNQTTIRRLVNFNFASAGAEDFRYPRLAAQQIFSIKFDELVRALKDLASGSTDLIQPDQDLEAHLRKTMGLPEKGEARERPQAPPAPQSPVPSPPPAGRAGKSEVEASDIPHSAPEASGRTPQLSRQPRGAERFLALQEMAGELDRGRDEIAAGMRRARSRVQAEIVNKLVNAPVRSMHRVSIAPDEKLTAEIEEVLGEVAAFGFEQVEKERARQRKGEEPPEAAEVRAVFQERKKKREPLGVYADAAVSEFTNTLTSRAANAVLDLKRRPGERTPGEVIRQAEEQLDEQSDKWIDGIGSKAANNAFADGRAEGYQEFADEIREVQYSALLDAHTCPPCQAADGETGATPDDIPAVPNPDCEGGDRCRCVHVFLFAEETKSAA